MGASHQPLGSRLRAPAPVNAQRRSLSPAAPCRALSGCDDHGMPPKKQDAKPKWLCKHCDGGDGEPFWNWGDNSACRKCKRTKSSAFLRNVKPEKPSTSKAEERAKLAKDATAAENNILKAKLQKLEQDMATAQAAGDSEDKAADQEGPKKLDGDEAFKAACAKCDRLAKELANF